MGEEGREGEENRQEHTYKLVITAEEGGFPSLSRCFSLCPPLFCVAALLSRQASFPLIKPASGCLTFLFDLELVSTSASVIYLCNLFKQFLHLNTANVHLFPSLVFGGVTVAVKSEKTSHFQHLKMCSF